MRQNAANLELLLKFPVVISVKCCLTFLPINLNMAFVYITVTDYGVLKSHDMCFLSKHISKTCLFRVNLTQMTLLKDNMCFFAHSVQYIWGCI